VNVSRVAAVHAVAPLRDKRALAAATSGRSAIGIPRASYHITSRWRPAAIGIVVLNMGHLAYAMNEPRVIHHYMQLQRSNFIIEQTVIPTRLDIEG
jgi:hypothetical protein